jgi:hypothetical protein
VEAQVEVLHAKVLLPLLLPLRPAWHRARVRMGGILMGAGAGARAAPSAPDEGAQLRIADARALQRRLGGERARVGSGQPLAALQRAERALLPRKARRRCVVLLGQLLLGIAPLRLVPPVQGILRGRDGGDGSAPRARSFAGTMRASRVVLTARRPLHGAGGDRRGCW